ncbi:hypothetical protein Nepgr_017365 [Nepenthes gracilis]|uniref:Uncharacterized protein n=1 Tax=Nepenthes gracilis TaxID=150966 RepID=A0AAD3XT11_NEPGR|nr:hypothetical protein Nepgr_017365 [Nepenthes gracilis]
MKFADGCVSESVATKGNWNAMDASWMAGNYLLLLNCRIYSRLSDERCSFRWLWNQLGPVLLVLLSDARIAGLGVWSVAVGFCFFVLMVESQPGIDDWTAAIAEGKGSRYQSEATLNPSRKSIMQQTRHWPPAILRQHTPGRNILFAGNHRRIIISHTSAATIKMHHHICTTSPESNALHQINSQVPHPVQPGSDLPKATYISSMQNQKQHP